MLFSGDIISHDDFIHFIKERFYKLLSISDDYYLYRNNKGNHLIVTSVKGNYDLQGNVRYSIEKFPYSPDKEAEKFVAQDSHQVTVFYTRDEMKSLEFQGQFQIVSYLRGDLLLSQNDTNEKFRYGVSQEDYAHFAQETYGKFYKEDGHFFLSLTTKRIILQETQIFRSIVEGDDTRNFDGYHPYIFEFLLDEDSQLHFKDVRGNYEIGKYYKIQFLEGKNSSKLTQTTTYGPNIFSGELYVANSPFDIQKKRVRVDPTEVLESDLAAFYYYRKQAFLSVSSSLGTRRVESLIRTHLGNAADHIIADHLFIGQGNCTRISIEDGSEIKEGYVDLGASLFYSEETEQNKRRIEVNQEKLAYEDPLDFFIISHPHFDHLAGICYLRKETMVKKNPLWLFPNILNFNHYAKYIDSILLFLIINKVDLVLVDFDNQVYEDTFLKVSRGQCGRGGNMNQTSIVISFAAGFAQTLLPGDCSYRYIHPAHFSKEAYDYIVASHHGDRLLSSDKDALARLTSPFTIGIFSVGKNHYGQPQSHHFNKFFYYERLDRMRPTLHRILL